MRFEEFIVLLRNMLDRLELDPAQAQLLLDRILDQLSGEPGGERSGEIKREDTGI